MPKHKRHNEVVIAIEQMKGGNERISVASVAKKLGLTSTAIRPDRHNETISLIEEAKRLQSDTNKTSTTKKEARLKTQYRMERDEYKEKYHEALGKIASLEYQVWELAREVANLKGTNNVTELKP